VRSSFLVGRGEGKDRDRARVEEKNASGERGRARESVGERGRGEGGRNRAGSPGFPRRRGMVIFYFGRGRGRGRGKRSTALLQEKKSVVCPFSCLEAEERRGRVGGLRCRLQEKRRPNPRLRYFIPPASGGGGGRGGKKRRATRVPFRREVCKKKDPRERGERQRVS